MKLNEKKIKFWKVDKLSIDEFINKYESKIAQNQYKIQNHNGRH